MRTFLAVARARSIGVKTAHLAMYFQNRGRMSSKPLLRRSRTSVKFMAPEGCPPDQMCKGWLRYAAGQA